MRPKTSGAQDRRYAEQLAAEHEQLQHHFRRALQERRLRSPMIKKALEQSEQSNKGQAPSIFDGMFED